MSRPSDESRAWVVSDINYDERFPQINKEVIITIALFLAHTVFLLVNIVLGTADGGLEHLTFGLPTWFVRQLSEFVVYIVIVFFMIDHVWSDMDVAPRGKLLKGIKK